MPEHVVPLLRQFVNRGLSQSVNDLVATVTESFRAENFQDLVPVEVVRTALAQLDRTQLSAEDLKLIALFERQSAAWDEGIAYPDRDEPNEG